MLAYEETRATAAAELLLAGFSETAMGDVAAGPSAMRDFVDAYADLHITPGIEAVASLAVASDSTFVASWAVRIRMAMARKPAASDPVAFRSPLTFVASMLAVEEAPLRTHRPGWASLAFAA